MKHQRLSTMLILLFGILLKPDIAFANWYTGYTPDNLYGIWARISTPASAPFVPEAPYWAGQSNWVSTNGPHWIQAGWLWYPNTPQNTPTRYVEWCLPGCETNPALYYKSIESNQNWGTMTKYEVSHDSAQGATIWCAWIDGVRKYCQDVVAAPYPLQAQSEIHESLQVELDTDFSQVRQQNSNGGTWAYPNFNGTNLSGEFPYESQQLGADHYHNYRVATTKVYLPLVGKNF
ncbi:MAG: hypothetical protein P1S60_09160 [Anaerolineae bacterium]|nr:hypothetical protein [Anaerolineae bacterium]